MPSLDVPDNLLTLHVANGPPTSPRRTILPWFVEVQEDMETLEVLEAGTCFELAVAHSDMTSSRAAPSGCYLGSGTFSRRHA
jgi:hypothetical protein